MFEQSSGSICDQPVQLGSKLVMERHKREAVLEIKLWKQPRMNHTGTGLERYNKRRFLDHQDPHQHSRRYYHTGNTLNFYYERNLVQIYKGGSISSVLTHSKERFYSNLVQVLRHIWKKEAFLTLSGPKNFLAAPSIEFKDQRSC
jgi:hypothetical protein